MTHYHDEHQWHGDEQASSDFWFGFAFACLALGFVAAVLFGTGVVRV